jgi:hypothetical protein
MWQKNKTGVTVIVRVSRSLNNFRLPQPNTENVLAVNPGPIKKFDCEYET